MNTDLIVAKRYAKALYEVAKDKNMVEQVADELNAVVGVFKENPEWYKIIQHPAIDVAAKKQMIEQVFRSSVSEAVYNTLQLIVERKREKLLDSLAGYYAEIVNEALGQATAKVYSPFELSQQELESIASTFSKATKKKIRLEPVIDKSLLGGLKVRIGDVVYDGSLAGKLERLSKSLK